MRQIEDLMVAIFKRLQVTVSNVTLTFVIQCNNCAYLKLKINYDIEHTEFLCQTFSFFVIIYI